MAKNEKEDKGLKGKLNFLRRSSMAFQKEEIKERKNTVATKPKTKPDDFDGF